MDLRGDIVFCDASQGPFTATLPPPASVGSGYVVTYKKTDASSNVVTIAPDGSETIDGQSDVQLASPYQSVQVATNGAGWFVLPVLPAGAGGVVGPDVSTDNALARFDGTGGDVLQNSGWTLSDAGEMTAGGPLDMAGESLTVDAVDQSYDDLGDVTGTATVTAIPYSRIRLTGDTTVTLTDPTAAHLGVRMLEVVQDATGGRAPTFTGFTWLGTEPAWASAAADAVYVLGWYVTPTGRKRIYVIEEPS